MREPTDAPDKPSEKDRAAAELGRRGGLKGGVARAARMTSDERSDAARLAASARWARVRSEGRTAGATKRSRDGVPFVFTLEPDEIGQITGTAVSGSGGLQSLQRRLREQLEAGSSVSFDNAELGQLIRYMTQRPGGGFQDRLRRAFGRSLKELIALD